ncbi:beta-1,3-galactosyl-O-glycosyl-glycoprotein beta-1,6-N-acetylglucosaminyltransferase-like isoform X2 [Melanotaenia boesemani]|uniref:beta-1,3-galactosyl-O-glycosyl-glycoprotein beta-1,6-N-acetylglucosaminyltransferase-like isoform X2 n=1 Tax=Melanotaenia boesemani TaxID=1250792 RepID=UPI001C04EE8F|nr:beta-1,3-galactosyl-O-glycosyl-glycoprotein beta-1,6-N-acetylglucosaminyltransferase-like isoform X2 [Melanotaenia boesemani]
MQFLRRGWQVLLLRITVVVGSLWMIFLVSQLDNGWTSARFLEYSWLEYADDDGSPEKEYNCPAILLGEREAVEQAKILTITKHFRKSIQIPDDYYINATQDCRAFKLSRKYVTFPLSKEEEDFPLAYSMVVHHKDFPLKTNLEMVRMLRTLRGGNSLESESMPPEKKWRVSYVHQIVNGGIQTTKETKDPPPFNLPIMSGNAYIVVSRGYVHSVLKDHRIRALIEWSKDTYSPDEHLWATIQRVPGVPGSKWPHRKYDMSDVNAIARLVKWQWHEGSEDSVGAVYPECKGNHVRSVCVYGAGDLQWLLEQDHLFANKFDVDTDPIAIFCLEKYLRQKALADLEWLEIVPGLNKLF